MFVPLIFVLFLGLAVNNENAVNKVESFGQFKSAVHQSWKERTPADVSKYNQ